MKKVWSMFVAVSALTLAACGAGQSNASNSEAGGSLDKSQQLVIYSNSASEGRKEWIEEKAKAAGYNIQVVDIPGGELVDRLIAEKNNGIADLVYGLNNLEYNKLKVAELLVKYNPSWSSDVDLSLGDKDGYFYPTVVQPLVLAGKPEVTMPSDWTDLTGSQYKGKYGIFSLGGGTSKIILSSILSRYQDTSGELGVSKEGWDVAKKYIQNAYIYGKDENYATTLLEGDKGIDYTMLWGSGFLQTETERSVDLQVMSPKVGVPFVTEQAGVIASSKKQELAKDFINWFGGEEVQAEWSQKFGTIPANTKALEKASDAVKTFRAAVNPQELDWTFIAENIDKWVEKAELEFVQ
ncbi:extracellular solute-binding protein [Streptococcus oralis]|uniref:Ferric iron ABC transporter, iron-binding protein n=1 Tax=Streptococcus oralis TaxID=1303 RepID=A0A139PFJ2_STROR|nr:extracellular solute-binding protein [Streptococcus oralis]KXT87989.1 Ferric iron ABC transporter, iron-binding protein [Streptococcus oralis]